MSSVTTSRFGVIAYSNEDVINFPKGVPGFAETEYLLLTKDAAGVLHWLQSIETPDLAFVVMEPSVYLSGYADNVSGDDMKRLGIDEAADALVLALVTLMADTATVNLKAPVVVNMRKRVGCQIILEKSSFKIKEPLLPILSSAPTTSAKNTVRNAPHHTIC